MEKLVPKDRGEEIAVFRSQVIGPVVHRALTHGDLKSAFEELAKQRFRPPGEERTRSFSVPTLERWYYRFKKGGTAALVPQRRSDAGCARALGEEEKQLVCDMRREHPSASAELMLRVLADQGRLAKGTVSPATLRRFFVERGLDRVSLRAAPAAVRLRWEASHPGAIWHGDVCHGPVLQGATQWQRLRIHALLDDTSRYVVALEARSSEREDDMLSLLVAAIRRWGKPDALYLDNGSTYSGKALATGCARLDVSLMHAKPYDPQARGKMERFWRTLRESLLDHLDRSLTLPDVQARLDAFLATHYHPQPHAGLAGDTPSMTWASRKTRLCPDDDLRRALTIRSRRRVSKDCVVGVDGRLFEVRQGFLAGRLVDVEACLVEGLAPVARVSHDGQSYELKPLDARANAHTRRPARTPPKPPTVPFDPFAPKKSV
jgi:transposase InsO family protein